MLTDTPITPSRSAEVENAVEELYAALRAGDVRRVAAVLSEDDGSMVFGTDGHECWSGPVAAEQNFRIQLEATGGFDLFDLAPVAFQHGGVGWFSDRPSLRLPDGTEVRCRLTGVFVREAGTWRLHQSHFSVGADVNARLFPT